MFTEAINTRFPQLSKADTFLKRYYSINIELPYIQRMHIRVIDVCVNDR